MKQKYTITIADMELNILSDAAADDVHAIASTLDRRMKDTLTRSPRCSKSEAALLCALDYCSERIKSQRRLKALEAKLAMTEATLEEVLAENEELKARLG